MADLKITELTENTTPISTDIIPMADDPGGSPLTQKITLANLGIIDGWIPASETWTYASANTITIPSGGASKYAVGDKIKWTQTTVKYGVIIAVADTLLTIAINTDYVVSNAAITANYYSHSSTPIGFPQWFAWSPSLTWTNGPTSPTDVARFTIQGRMVTFHFKRTGTASGSGSTVNIVPAPVASTLNTNVYYFSFSSWVNTNADANDVGTFDCKSSLYNKVSIYSYFASGNYRMFEITGSYEI